MAELFDIDHETGDLSQYDSTVTDGGDLSVTAAAALAGTAFGLQCLIDDGFSLYGVKNQADPGTGKYRSRFYIDPNSLFWIEDGQHGLLYHHVSIWPNYIMVMDFGIAGGTYILTMRPYKDTGAAGWKTASMSDDVHYVEIYIRQASTDVAADGTCEWWIDGVSQGSWTNLDNYDIFANMDKIYIGAYGGIDFGTAGTYYIDQLKANDDGSEIGPHIEAASRHNRPFMKIEGAERFRSLMQNAIY